MTDTHVPRVAVIGAGMAGLACASKLAGEGLSVSVFEKSRGIGGRIATRRTSDNLHFDHGAQYFTAQTPDFREFTRKQLAAGTLDKWAPDGKPGTARPDWLVGRPSMNAFLKPLASPLAVRLGVQVSGITPATGGWTLNFDGAAQPETFDAVIVTAPGPQARALTTASPGLQQKLEAVEIAPCWALLLAVNKVETTSPDILDSPHPDIAWMAYNASKPGRSAAPGTWVVHASSSFSTHHLEEAPETVLAHLLERALPLAGHLREDVIYATTHRWRFARTLKPAGEPFLSDETGTLLAAGDWCLGARVESAFESGQAAAMFLARKLIPAA